MSYVLFSFVVCDKTRHLVVYLTSRSDRRKEDSPERVRLHPPSWRRAKYRQQCGGNCPK